jgi:hypothetical protein
MSRQWQMSPEREKERRESRLPQVDDFRTFLGEFVSYIPQVALAIEWHS